MEEFIKQYGGVLLIVVAILVLIGVVVLVINGIGAQKFQDLINQFFDQSMNKANESGQVHPTNTIGK